MQFKQEIVDLNEDQRPEKERLVNDFDKERNALEAKHNQEHLALEKFQATKREELRLLQLQIDEQQKLLSDERNAVTAEQIEQRNDLIARHKYEKENQIADFNARNATLIALHKSDHEELSEQQESRRIHLN